MHVLLVQTYSPALTHPNDKLTINLNLVGYFLPRLGNDLMFVQELLLSSQK